MQRPSPALLALRHLGVIGKIEIDYRHIHTPKGGTYVRLHGSISSLDGRWEEYRGYLDLRVDWNSVAHIKPKFEKELEAWWLFAEREKKELADYERLKKKFGEA